MNKDRRKQIAELEDRLIKASKDFAELSQQILDLQDVLDGIPEDVESIMDEEQDYFDSLTNQDSERAENSQQAIGELTEAKGYIDELVDALSSVPNILDALENTVLALNNAKSV